MEETNMLFPLAQTELWKKFRTTIEKVITETVGPPINYYILRKSMLFRNDICNIYKVSQQIFYPQPKQQVPKILRYNVDDIFKRKYLSC